MSGSRTFRAETAPPELLELVGRLMPLLLEGPHPDLAVLREQYRVSRIGTVELTGVGFFVSFDVPMVAPLSDHRSMAGGNVNVTVAGVKDGAGCVLFVRDGRLSTLEGYTHAGDEWPEDLNVLALSDPMPIQP